MTVAEWIDWLKAKPQEAEVLLRDPDTEWLLPLRTEPGFDTDLPDQPPNSVLVFADYIDHKS